MLLLEHVDVLFRTTPLFLVTRRTQVGTPSHLIFKGGFIFVTWFLVSAFRTRMGTSSVCPAILGGVPPCIGPFVGLLLAGIGAVQFLVNLL